MPTMKTGLDTAHFWWIAYLRASPNYWWICQEEGRCLDPRLVQVWRDFGDLYRYETLTQWWVERGAALFAPAQASLPHVDPVVLPAGLALLPPADLRRVAQHLLYVSVEPDVAVQHPRDSLGDALLSLAHYRRRQAQSLRYPLLRMDAKSCRKLIPSYQAHALEAYVQAAPATDPAHRWGGYEMGQRLALGQALEPGKITTLAQAKKRQNSFRALFCQAKQGAQAIMANVEIGRFPSRAAVEVVPRWTQSQLKRLAASGWHSRWHSTRWVRNEQRFMRGAQASLQRVPQYILGLTDVALQLTSDLLSPTLPTALKWIG